MKSRDTRAANFLVSSLRFFKSLKSNLLKPEVYHMNPAKTNSESYWNKVNYFPKKIATPLAYLFQTFPLDMSQYSRLFQTARIPRNEEDEIRTFSDSKHILIIYRGQFFTFPVLDENDNILDGSYYLENIRAILNETENSKKSSGIGILTAANRELWSKAREHLENLSDDNKDTK